MAETAKPVEKPVETAKAPEPAKVEKPPETDPLSKFGLDDAGLKKREATPVAAPKDETPPGPKQLRDAYNSLKQRTEKLESDLAAAKAPTNQKELELAKAREAQLAKNYETLQKKIEEIDYLQSDDYQKKYVEPRSKAFKEAISEVTQLEITDDAGNSRKATEQDFRKILKSETADAYKIAKTFGDAAPDVMAMRRQILGMVKTEKDAIDSIATTVQERKAQQAAAQEAEYTELKQVFDGRMAERFETLSASPIEGWEPPEDVKTQGKLLASVAFTNPDGLAPKELARVQSEVAARAASYRPVALLAEHLMEEVKTLKAKLEGYEKSTPKTGGTSGSTGSAPVKSLADEFDSFMATHQR